MAYCEGDYQRVKVSAHYDALDTVNCSAIKVINYITDCRSDAILGES